MFDFVGTMTIPGAAANQLFLEQQVTGFTAQ
jgi:hypothetical protein